MNLTNTNIESTYQNVIVTTDNYNITNGTGSAITSLNISASYALNGGGSGTTLTTGSTYPVTSSWATSISGSNGSLVAGVLQLFNSTNNKWYAISVSGSTGSEQLVIA